MSIKRLFADPQFVRQIVHGHTAESVTEKVAPRRIDDSLSNKRTLAASRSRFVGILHDCCWAAVAGSNQSYPIDCLGSSPKRDCVIGCCGRPISGEYEQLTMETIIVYLVSDGTKMLLSPYRS